MKQCFCRCFRKCFIEHPESVGENYFSHGIKAMWFGTRLVVYGTCEFIHALVPGIDCFKIFDTTSIDKLQDICAELRERKNMD